MFSVFWCRSFNTGGKIDEMFQNTVHCAIKIPIKFRVLETYIHFTSLVNPEIIKESKRSSMRCKVSKCLCLRVSKREMEIGKKNNPKYECCKCETVWVIPTLLFSIVYKVKISSRIVLHASIRHSYCFGKLVAKYLQNKQIGKYANANTRRYFSHRYWSSSCCRNCNFFIRLWVVINAFTS